MLNRAACLQIVLLSCRLFPRERPGSDGDNISYSTSCHVGVGLFRSPGVSLALHPICGGLSHGSGACCAHALPQIGPHTLPTAPVCPAHPWDLPVWHHGEPPSLPLTHVSISFPLVPVAVSPPSPSALHCAPIFHHFPTFQTGSRFFYDECL